MQYILVFLSDMLSRLCLFMDNIAINVLSRICLATVGLHSIPILFHSSIICAQLNRSGKSSAMPTCKSTYTGTFQVLRYRFSNQLDGYCFQQANVSALRYTRAVTPHTHGRRLALREDKCLSPAF